MKRGREGVAFELQQSRDWRAAKVVQDNLKHPWRAAKAVPPLACREGGSG